MTQSERESLLNAAMSQLALAESCDDESRRKWHIAEAERLRAEADGL